MQRPRARPRRGVARTRDRLGDRCAAAAGRRAPSPSAPVPRHLRRASARRSSTSCERSATSWRPRRSSASRATSRRRTPCAASLSRGAPTCSSSARIIAPGCSAWSRAITRMQVLHGAPCSVAVAPDPLAPRSRAQRIGVGIDDTPESTVRRWSWRASSPAGPAPGLVAARRGRRRDPRLGRALGHAVLRGRAPGARRGPPRGVIEELLARRLESCEDVAPRPSWSWAIPPRS